MTGERRFGRSLGRALRLGVWLVAVVAGVVLGYRCLHGPSPLERARRVASTLKLDVTPGPSGWISEHELLVWRHEGTGDGTPVVIDFRNGQQRELTALAGLIAKNPAPGHTHWQWRPSPAGNWLLGCAVEDRDTQSVRTLVFALDGRTVMPLPDLGASTPNWLKDGANLIGSGWDSSKPVVRQTAISGRPRTRTLGTLTGKGCSEFELGFADGMLDGGSMTHTSERRLEMVEALPHDPSSRFGVWCCDLSAKPPVLTIQRIQPPEVAPVCHPVISPNGSRIAWPIELNVEPVRTFWDRMQRRLFGRAAMSPFGELCITDRDGKNVRVLGVYNPGDSMTAVSHLRWTPDGKSLVFERDTALWIMPAD